HRMRSEAEHRTRPRLGLDQHARGPDEAVHRTGVMQPLECVEHAQSETYRIDSRKARGAIRKRLEREPAHVLRDQDVDVTKADDSLDGREMRMADADTGAKRLRHRQ